mgnify:CR=1 FL=1
MKAPLKLALLSGTLLAGCSSVTFEPSKVGAENDCAQYSANLSMYNDCMQRVDANFRAYEQQKRLSEEDGG